MGKSSAVVRALIVGRNSRWEIIGSNVSNNRITVKANDISAISHESLNDADLLVGFFFVDFSRTY